MKKITIIIIVLLLITTIYFIIKSPYDQTDKIIQDHVKDYDSCINKCSKENTTCIKQCQDQQEKKALNENNALYCESLSGEEKDKCFEKYNMIQAVTTDDASECSKITDTLKRKECKTNFIINKAVSEKSPETCDELKILNPSMIPHCKDNVYMTMAITQRDSTLCKSITQEHIKTICISRT